MIHRSEGHPAAVGIDYLRLLHGQLTGQLLQVFPGDEDKSLLVPAAPPALCAEKTVVPVWLVLLIHWLYHST